MRPRCSDALDFAAPSLHSIFRRGASSGRADTSVANYSAMNARTSMARNSRPVEIATSGLCRGRVVMVLRALITSRSR